MKVSSHFTGAVVAVFFTLIGCTVDRSITHCSEGEREACTCEDGTKGFRSCIDGIYEECSCDADATYVDVGNKKDSSVGEDANGGRTTEQDNGKDETSKIDSGRNDTGLDGTDSLDAEASSDAEEDDAVSSDMGVDSDTTETGTDSAHDSGEQDSGSDAGSDAGNDAGNTTTVYGQCEQGECSGDQECTVVIGGTGTYCSIECEETEQCPEPTSGTAVKRCSTRDGMCRLNCASGDCPDGMECFQEGMTYTCVFLQPTTIYGRCNEEECTGDQECTEVNNGTGTYCSIECEETEQCPEPTSGTAVRRCSTVDDMCRLDCQSGDCPDGMECFEGVARSTCVWE